MWLLHLKGNGRGMRTTVGQARFGITTGSGMENRACDLREAPQHPKLSAGLEWLELEGFWILILGPAGQLIPIRREFTNRTTGQLHKQTNK